ncbi:nitroreductase family protein [Actinokineospora sp. PR83]|uniref:nitroreductase family protein n=1 Tax=Actinokineospora sp. PR83 TaxID=2884908 RepID=UPI0027DF7E19|nr:nitroreductase family protein [Actinokineospora sp. PR83]MCG8919168.1 nitroreductase family protein [Actinokineospora sp. PR83]
MSGPGTPPGGQALPESAVDALAHCMRTLRSVRRFLAADVDQRSVEFVLELATRAGSAKNRQPWRFVVVRDARVLAELTGWYRRSWQKMADLAASRPELYPAGGRRQAQLRESEFLARSFGSVPVVVVACFIPSPSNPADFYGGASVYPAVQNLLLAARAIGLGGTLTTLQAVDELPEAACLEGGGGVVAELRELLGIPAEVVPAAVVPLGWPAEPLTANRRTPVREVSSVDRWDSRWSTG